MNFFDWTPKAGMIIYVTPLDERRNPFYDEIKSVGHTYFNTERGMRFNKETKDDTSAKYSANNMAFSSKEMYLKYKSFCEMRRYIYNNIQSLPDEYVEQLYEILAR